MHEPSDPEPNPCPYCEAELGEGEGCDHCKMASGRAEAESKLNDLRHKLHCRARNLAWLPAGPEYAARRAEGVALLLELGGLPLPRDFMAQARAAMMGEYGEHAPYRAGGPGKLGHSVPDADIVARFMEYAHGETLASSPAVFTGEILSAKPATHADQLWWADDDQGVPRVFTQAERLRGKSHRGGSTQWGLTLRESIEKALDSEARSAAHWLEFQAEYLRPPKNLDVKASAHGYINSVKVSFVVGIEAYTAYVGKHKSEHYASHGLGFGGSEFLVRLDDGREFFTDNNWSRGQVPPHLRKLLKSNAVFVRKPETVETEAA